MASLQLPAKYTQLPATLRPSYGVYFSCMWRCTARVGAAKIIKLVRIRNNAPRRVSPRGTASSVKIPLDARAPRSRRRPNPTISRRRWSLGYPRGGAGVGNQRLHWGPVVNSSTDRPPPLLTSPHLSPPHPLFYTPTSPIPHHRPYADRPLAWP